MAKEEETGPKSNLDLRFKEGQTIQINMKITVCITLKMMIPFQMGAFTSKFLFRSCYAPSTFTTPITGLDGQYHIIQRKCGRKTFKVT